MSTRLPAAFQRLSWSNLLAQLAEQLSLAAAPIVAVLALQAGPGEIGLLAGVQSLPFLLLAIPLVLVGRGILRWEPWAHTGGILAGAASILLFPVGTAIGLYALGVMLLPETEPLFLNPPAPLKRPEPRRNAPTKLP